MTVSAAVIPFFAGFAAVVVAEPPRVLSARTIPVGELVPLEEPTERYDARRVCTEEHATGAARAILRELQAHGASRVVIEWREHYPRVGVPWSGESTAVGQAVARALIALCADARIEVDSISPEWRAALAGRSVEAVARAGLAWSEEATYRGAFLAGAALVVSSGIELPPMMLPEGVARRERAAEAEDAPPREYTPREREAWRAERALGEAAAREVRVAEPVGPRIAAIDPGSSHLGLVVAEGSAHPLRCVLATTLPVGEQVPLARPRVTVRADGTERVTTHRHSLTSEHVDALASAVVDALQRHGAERLLIEHVESVRMNPAAPGSHGSIATAIARATWLDGAIGERARAAGIRVERVTATTWRNALLPRVGRTVDAGAIPETVRSGFTDWPRYADEHARDAAGILLWATLPEAAPAPPKPRARKAAEPRERVRAPAAEPGVGWRERAAAKRAAASAALWEERRAAGCTCTSKRHPKTCPAYVPTTYKRKDAATSKRAALRAARAARGKVDSGPGVSGSSPPSAGDAGASYE